MRGFRQSIDPCEEDEGAENLFIGQPGPFGGATKQISSQNLIGNDAHHKKRKKTDDVTHFLTDKMNTLE